MVGCAGERLNGSLWINKAGAVAGNKGGEHSHQQQQCIAQRTEGGEGDQRCASKVICT